MWAGAPRRGFLATVGGAALAAAAVRPARSLSEIAADSRHYRLRMTRLATGLEHPWGLAVLPTGNILVTERPGRLRLVRPHDGWVSGPLAGVPPVVALGQGGLLDVALHPRFSTNRLVYLTYAAGTPEASFTALALGRLASGGLIGTRRIFRARPSVAGGVHFGSRVTFDGKGHLFLSIGERGEMERAQRPGEHHGKIVRLREDGSIPSDNPFRGRPGFRPGLWAIGVRNPQGLCFDRATGRLWECEHGPMGGDEINLIQLGRNYGWPRITHGLNYDGTPISGITRRPGMEQPRRYWTPSIAPSGLCVYRGRHFAAWQGNLLMGALRGQMLVRLALGRSGRQIVEEEHLLTGLLGRIRAVAVGPAGKLLLLTDENPGALWRVEIAGGRTP